MPMHPLFGGFYVVSMARSILPQTPGANAGSLTNALAMEDVWKVKEGLGGRVRE